MNQRFLEKIKTIDKEKCLYKCQKCRDVGYIIIPQDHAQPLIVKCQCMEVKETKLVWKNSGLNAELVNYTFTSYKTYNEVSKICKDKATSYFINFDEIRDKRHNSILFCGQVGSGKTHLGVALCLNFLEEKINVQYFSYRDVITNLKNNIMDSNAYKTMINRFKTCHILFIDDLFKGKITESDVNIIFEIVNYRYINCMPLIISSELNIEKILSIDEGLGSRIFEMCRKYIVEIPKNTKNNYRLN